MINIQANKFRLFLKKAFTMGILQESDLIQSLYQ